MQKIIKQLFTVKYKYNIFFTKNVFDIKNKILINELRKDKRIENKVLIVIDKNITKKNKKLLNDIKIYFEYYKHFAKLVYKPILLTGGERIKNHYSIVKYFYKIIETYKVCRHSYIIAIGGGTIQDLIGYIASTAHRGIKLIRMPTTILSQDDSGVGVKNGINFKEKKNFIGCFSTANSVINDYNLLKTLDEKKKIEGISEAIKVALIKNKNLFNYIQKNSNEILKNIHIRKIIYESAKLHAKHISQSGDPFERTSSRPLDFGHWIAHKLESLSKYKISHGQAVAIGITIDSTYSYLVNILKKNKWKQIINVFKNIKIEFFSDLLLIKNNKNKYEIFNGLEEFREHLGGKLTISLIMDIGKKFETHHISEEIYIKSIKLIKKINEKSKREIKKL